MRHTLYEDPITHKFALIRLPSAHIEGDTIPIPQTVRWFCTRQEAVARLANLFDEDEDGQNDDRVQ